MVAAPPYYLPGGQPELQEYLDHLVPELPLPLFLYNMPALTKVSFELETVRAAMDDPRIVGLKDSSGDMAYFRSAVALLPHRPDWSLLVGPEEHLMDALLAGGHGGVCGGANLFPALYVGLFEAGRAGDSVPRPRAARAGHARQRLALPHRPASVGHHQGHQVRALAAWACATISWPSRSTVSAPRNARWWSSGWRRCSRKSRRCGSIAAKEHDMRRREFLKTTAGMTVLGAWSAAGVRAHESTASADPDPLVLELVRANDEQVARLLPRQERRASHRRVGGLPNEHGIYTAGEAAGFVSSLACASCAPGSSFHHSTALVEPLQLAVRFLLEVQHDDGTIDLHTTNFHSPPDTAFVLEALCPACTVMQRDAWPPLAAVVADLRRFAVRAGVALVTGGVHTPNHRWVVSAALARLNALSPDPDYVARIDQWLAETVDIDPDGQFTERSTAVYSPVVDRALLTVARLLDCPALREPVRRNLEMTVFYVHPDGEVVTEASRRQDKYQRGGLARDYYWYRSLALLDGNGRFAAMARQIEQAERPHLTGELPAFLEEPDLQQPLPAAAPLPADYVRVFSYSGLARIRRGRVSATILADNSSVFSLRKGSAALEAVRLASAFFGKGQFVGDRLEVRGGRFILRQVLDGPYFQPFSPEPDCWRRGRAPDAQRHACRRQPCRARPQQRPDTSNPSSRSRKPTARSSSTWPPAAPTGSRSRSSSRSATAVSFTGSRPCRA